MATAATAKGRGTPGRVPGCGRSRGIRADAEGVGEDGARDDGWQRLLERVGQGVEGGGARVGAELAGDEPGGGGADKRGGERERDGGLPLWVWRTWGDVGWAKCPVHEGFDGTAVAARADVARSAIAEPAVTRFDMTDACPGRRVLERTHRHPATGENPCPPPGGRA